MGKKLSKDFYIVMAWVLAFFVLFIFSVPIKKGLDNLFQSDHRVIKKYYSALNRKRYKVAYGLLVDLTFKYKTGENKMLEFDVRPDYKKFEKDNKKVDRVKIRSIKREDKHCYPEVGLRCFKVEAAIKYKDIVVTPAGKTVLYIYTLNTGKEPKILAIRATP
ncbi:hypothetical protein ACFLZ2_00370 [Candidatus Margulisiibacteriota bacterium]